MLQRSRPWAVTILAQTHVLHSVVRIAKSVVTTRAITIAREPVVHHAQVAASVSNADI